MRRSLFAVLPMLLCLLTACGGKETDALQAPMDFRTQLLASDGCSFTAEVTADVEDRVWQYALACEARTDGSADFALLAPESIAGITAELSGDTGKLRFDGAYVDFGLLWDGALSPIAAPQTVFRCWTEEYIASAGDGLVCYEAGYDADALTVSTLFDEQNRPVRAEIAQGGRVQMTLDITDFAFR